MDEKRYNEINTAVQKIANGYTAYNAVNPYYGAKSGMDVDETYGFLNKQAAYDADWKIAKGFYNGLVANTGRGIMGALALVRDMNIDSLKERGLAYNENTAFEDVANSDVLTPYDVKGRNELEQLGIDIASGAGQLAGQAATTALTGGTGSMVAMGTQIAGNQYLDLRQQGVSAENARWPSITNALMQAPLERFGLEGILAKLPAKSVLREKAKRIAQAAITEGVTEWMQQYPEEITNLYALQPGDRNDPEQRRKAWFAAGDEFIRNFGDITREGAYAGLIGGMLGGFGGGVNVMFRSVDRQIRKQVHNELLQDTAKRIDNVKKSGISPDYARNVINANNPGDKIYVDGETMHQYMQSGNATEIAKNIGVTEDEVQKAAESGTDVAINRGDFEAAAAKMPDFFESVQNGVAFEEGGYTLTKAQLEEEQQKLLREVQREDPLLRQQMDDFRMQMQRAGVNKKDIDKTILMLEAHAMATYPDEPSRLFIDYPLEIQRIVRPQNGKEYFQTASASERLLKDEQNFAKTVDDFLNNKLTENTSHVMTTPLALKLVGARILPVEISNENLEKVLKGKHSKNMSADIVKQLPRALADPLMIFDSYTGSNGEKRKVVVVDLKAVNGATIVVPLELEAVNKDKKYTINEMKSAYGKTDKFTGEPRYEWFVEQLDAGNLQYINKEKTARLFENEKPEWLMPFLNSDGFLNNSIPNEDDLRNEREANEGYYQSADNQQEKKPHKGSFRMNDKGQSVIELFQTADSSTIIHELGHYFVEALARDVNNGKATEQQQRDWETLLKYAETTNEEWLAPKSAKDKVHWHERFATGFEQYLMEGKAPNREMRSVFRHFKKWLLKIYQSIEDFLRTHKEHAAPLNDDVRQVFGRMLAAEEDVRAAQKIDGYFNDLPAVVLDSLPESWQKRVDDFANRARDKAIDILTQKSLANFTQDRKERIAEYRSEILPQAEADVNKMPLYNAADDIETYIGDGTRTAKSTARKYLNAEGKVYANWREEWEAVRADIDERLNPIIDQLKAGMNQGVSRRRDEVTGRWLRESNNDMWYREWWRVHKRQPTAKELRDMAYEIYVGDMNMPGWINDSAEAAEYYAQNKAEIDELLAREEDLIQYKDDVAKYRHRGLTESDRMTFDMLAEQYGYTCGDELAQKIINSPTKQAAITARADEYVQQAFPDIYKERELAADTVRESLYNDESGAVIGLEQQLIQDYISEAQIKNRSAEANRRIAAARRQQAIVAAQTEINKMPVEDAVRTSRFISAERLAAQKSAEAMALGAAAQKKANEATNDAARSEAQTNANTFFRQALRYKNQQAFNHAMARESMKMRTAVTKYRNYINRQFTASRKTWVSDEHFSQAAAILARMGFVRKDYDPYLKKQKLADYNAEMQELYGTGAIASWIMDENISLRNPMQLTFSQFEDIAEALQNIKANAKAQEGNGTLGQNVPFSDLLNDIMRHLDKLDTKFLPAAGKRQQATPLARMIASARNIDNLFEWMDKWSYGFFSKVFGEQIKHCNDHEAELTMAWKNRVTAAQKEWLPDAAAKREADRRFYSDELGCDVDKHVLVRLLMNLGNEGNARVLCSRPPNAMAGSKLWVYPEGNITYEQAVMETKANLLTYLGENLTVADIQYAQDMIDAANMYWEEFSALEKRTKGFAPKKVEALPVEITLADGTSVVFKGGYFPLIRDGEFGSKPQGQDVIVSDTEPNQGRNIRTLATGNGNLKERVNASYPIDLTRGAEFYVMQNGIHDLCWRETLTGFRRILNDESMYTMLKEKLGPAQMRVFREMLEKAAQPFKMPGTSEGENLLNDAAGWLRRKTVAVAIMGNIKTMLQNGGNLLLYGRSVEGFGYADTLAAMANWGKNWQSGDGEKGLRAFVTSKSVFMRERTENPDITLREIKDEDNLNPIEKKAMDWGGKAMAYTDNFTAMPVWAQAYMKKINAGATEQEAVDFADAVIRRTLGSSRLTDVSSLQRGGNLAKLFMMFQGFFNTQYNQWERQYGMFRNKWKKGDWQSRFEAAQNICAFAAGKWFAVCLVNLLLAAENPFDDDDDEYMKITKELFHYPISLLGPVGTAGNAVLDNAMGFSGYGYRMTAAESAINSVIRTAGKVNKVATDEDSELTDLIEPAATLGGYVVGAPGIVNKLFFNAWDILYNDMEPQVGDLFKRRPERER